jgi:hypothetical protein
VARLEHTGVSVLLLLRAHEDDVMAKIRMQQEKASSGRKMASVIFSKADISFLKELIAKHPEGFYMSNVQIIKPGDKV